MPGKNEALEILIRAWGYDPDEVVKTEDGDRRLFDHVEGFVMAAFDTVEEETEPQ